jgi:hypothetical protein
MEPTTPRLEAPVPPVLRFAAGIDWPRAVYVGRAVPQVAGPVPDEAGAVA